MLDVLFPAMERLVAAPCALVNVQAALLDMEGRTLWRSSSAMPIPATDTQPPCLKSVAERGPVINQVVRSHPACQHCPATNCRYSLLLGLKLESRLAGALAISVEDQIKPQQLDSLLGFASGLAGALGAILGERQARQDADRALLRLQQVISGLNALVITTDTAGQVVAASASAESAFGQLLGRSAETFLAAVPKERLSITPLYVRGEPDGHLVQVDTLGAPARREAQAVSRLYTFDSIKGYSPALAAVKQTALRAAATEATVLIHGESGTGKEVFAQAIHSASQRNRHPFVAVNCAAIPDSLLESELFGYDEGAFTGARKGGKPGKFEIANGGTLFLDEVGDMPLLLQAKLLRVLQERVVERVGASRVHTVDVRIIAATNRDLTAAIRQGRFREDLYYRLNVIPLVIPPLRHRREDVHLLVDYFLKKYGRLLGKEGKRLSSDVLNLLYRYSWPGNIREVENTVQYIVSLENGPVVTLESLPPHMRTLPAGSTADSLPQEAAPRPERRRGNPPQRQELQQMLAAHGQSTDAKRVLAESLGVSLATLYRWIQQSR